MSTPVRPTTHVRPTPAPRKRKRGRGLGIFLFIAALWIGLGVYSATRSHHSTAHDRSDLIVTPAATTLAAGGSGVVTLRLDNAGPDNLGHTVRFTLTAKPPLTITGAGTVDEGDPFPLDLRSNCQADATHTRMTCDWFMDLDTGRHDVWRVPVRVAPGTQLGTTSRLTVSAADKYGLYVDPNKANNTNVGLPVIVGRPGHAPSSTPTPVRPRPSSVPPSRPSSSRPTVPGGTVTTPAPRRPTSTTSHTSAGTRIRNGARDAAGPVIIVGAAIVGLLLLIYLWLIVLARRQRRLPLDYIPPRDQRP